MKRIKIIYVFIFLIIMISGSVKAQENKVKFSGNILTDERFLLKDQGLWAWNENRLNLKLEAKFKNRAKFYTEVWLRNLGLPKIASASELYNKDIVDPYNLSVREAYVEFYGLLSKNLDVKIGKQRIAWGTADKLNPTDNLNPYDREDIMDFGRHNGSIGINAIYYFSSDFSLQAVYIPLFQPATMPIGVFAVALTPEMQLPPPAYIVSASDSLVMPVFGLTQSATTGARFKAFLGGFDFSISYVYGFDGLAAPLHNSITPVNLEGGVNVRATTGFYRQSIFGADFAGSIGGVGIWGEAAGFLPDRKVVMTNDIAGQPLPEMDSLIVDNELYLKFVLGMDYTFRDGSYINFQYLHGFINERGRGNQNDYFMLGYNKTFFEDKLKIEPLTGGFVVSDWNDISNNYAVIWAPSIIYKPVDNAEIQLGAYVFTGKGDNLFNNLIGYDMGFLKVKYSF